MEAIKMMIREGAKELIIENANKFELPEEKRKKLKRKENIFKRNFPKKKLPD